MYRFTFLFQEQQFRLVFFCLLLVSLLSILSSFQIILPTIVVSPSSRQGLTAISNRNILIHTSFASTTNVLKKVPLESTRRDTVQCIQQQWHRDQRRLARTRLWASSLAGVSSVNNRRTTQSTRSSIQPFGSSFRQSFSFQKPPSSCWMSTENANAQSVTDTLGTNFNDGSPDNDGNSVSISRENTSTDSTDRIKVTLTSESVNDHSDSKTTSKVSSRSPASTVPGTVEELLDGIRSLYDNLERRAALNYDCSPTVRFSYVTPPMLESKYNGTNSDKTYNTYNTYNTYKNNAGKDDSKTIQNAQKRTTTWNNSNIQSMTMTKSNTTSSPSRMLLEELKPNPSKPLAVYLPGLDGFGISACTNQFDDLSNSFELWRLVVSLDDRTSFTDLVQHCVTFLQQMKAIRQSEYHSSPVILIGESFGGLLAAAVAIHLEQQNQHMPKYSSTFLNTFESSPGAKPTQNLGTSLPETLTRSPTTNSTTKQTSFLDGLVLVNPATSFGNTNWDVLVPLLTLLDVKSSTSTSLATPASSTTTLTPYGVVGSLVLSALIPDTDQYRRILQTLFDALRATNGDTTAVIDNIIQGFRLTQDKLPSPLLRHRVSNWLMVGSDVVNENLHRLQNVSTLLVVGEQDRLLPSSNELDRMMQVAKSKIEHQSQDNSSISPPWDVLKVPNRGHFVLDESVNLTEAILYYNPKILDPLRLLNQKPPSDFQTKNNPLQEKINSNKIPKYPQYDPITDWTLPDDVNNYISTSVQPFRDVFSPIFISTNPRTGERRFGLGQLPARESYYYQNDHGSKKKRRNPILFVGNHQLFALDMQLYISELYEQRGVFPRGLAHPVLFEMGSPSSNDDVGLRAPRRRPFDGQFRGRTPGLTKNNNNAATPGSSFENFGGAVLVNPKNYYRLLQTGQDVLLFPGGAKEAQCSITSYPLFWPETKTDFVRTAARFNATIIPFSAVGMVDSFTVLAEVKDLARLPILGEQIRQLNRNITAARFDEKNNENEIIGFPIAFPGPLPMRNYFLFGAPIDTTDIDPVRDRDRCDEIYKQTQQCVRKGLDDLLHARKQDPYHNNVLGRIAYERLFQKQAPTFSIDVLN